MKALKKRIYKNRGQVTVEYILLAVALIVLFHVSTSALKDNRYLENFQKIPNQILVNMAENGNWIITEGGDEDKSRNEHPNHFKFHYTPKNTN